MSTKTIEKIHEKSISEADNLWDQYWINSTFIHSHNFFFFFLLGIMFLSYFNPRSCFQLESEKATSLNTEKLELELAGEKKLRSL